MVVTSEHLAHWHRELEKRQNDAILHHARKQVLRFSRQLALTGLPPERMFQLGYNYAMLVSLLTNGWRWSNAAESDANKAFFWDDASRLLEAGAWGRFSDFITKRCSELKLPTNERSQPSFSSSSSSSPVALTPVTAPREEVGV